MPSPPCGESASRIAGPCPWGSNQGGEFTFVLLVMIPSFALLSDEHVKMVNLIAALSMGISPLFFVLNDRLVQPRFR